MAQESWQMDKDETGCQPPEGPMLCSNNCGFFGSATTMNLCSQCYRDAVLKQTKAAEAAAAISAVHSEQARPGTRQMWPEVAVPEAGTSSQSRKVEISSSELSSKDPAQQPNRCFFCKKRVGLTGFKCRCGNFFCSLHRYHDKHSCSFDYRVAAQEAIAKANPTVKADKVDKI